MLIIPLFLAAVLAAADSSQGKTREPNEDDIHFYLFTKVTGAETPAEVDFNNFDSLLAAGFNPSSPTILVSHGYSDEGIGFGRRFSRVYLPAGDYNIISIDWGKLAAWYDYVGAAVR